jgi:hypothetical protein
MNGHVFAESRHFLRETISRLGTQALHPELERTARGGE